MIGADYNHKKEAVIGLFNRYLEIRGSNDDGIVIEELQAKIKRLKDDTFNLYVVGEAKAGKSTLINAILGHQVMPSRVLQCSSAVIEIRCSEDLFVETSYADGTRKREDFNPQDDDHGDAWVDAVAECLRSAASVQSEYREIPSAIIDGYIVENRNRLDDDGRIPKNAELPIKEWLEAGHWGDDEKTRQLMETYARERSLAQIPISIQLGIKFPKTIFPGFRVVDSPGINAPGGFERITYEHLWRADAFLFVQSLVTSVENKNFIDFIKKNVQKKQKEALFLALTHKSKCDDYELTQKVNQARFQYRSVIEGNRIFDVDSIAQLVLHDIHEGNSVNVLREKYDREIQEYSAAALSEHDKQDKTSYLMPKKSLLEIKFPSHLDITSDDAEKRLEEIANFNGLETAIDTLVSQAGDILIHEILEHIDHGFSETAKKINVEINDLNNDEFQDPQSYAAEIKRQKEIIENHQLKANEFSEEISEHFLGLHTELDFKFKELVSSTIVSLKTCETQEECFKVSMEYGVNFNSLISKYSDQIKDAYKRCQDELQLELEKPDINIYIPKIDIGSLVDDARKKSYEFEWIEVPREPEGLWEKIKSLFGVEYKVKKARERLNEEKLLENLREGIIRKILEIPSRGPKLIGELVRRIDRKFKDKVVVVLGQRKNYLGEFRKIADDAQKKFERIKNLENNKEKIRKELDLIEEIM